MSPASLWLVRHGETPWSLTGQYTSRTDVPLTEKGEVQATVLGQALREVKFDLVESSPRQRAVRTAELAQLKATVNDDLAEWDYGQLEGKTIEQIRSSYPGWAIWDGPWPGGEEPSQVVARADRVVQGALALPGAGKALVVGHGHILRVIAARWLHQPPSAGRYFAIATATVSVLGWEHSEPVVRCWNIPPDGSDLARALAD
ncbi:MAG: histidine phosphatase family protein [Acidimicrobiales bacterium]